MGDLLKTPAVTSPIGHEVQFRLLVHIIIVVVSLGCSVKHMLPGSQCDSLSPHMCQSTVGTCREYKGWHRQQNTPSKGGNLHHIHCYSMHQVHHKNIPAIQSRKQA